MASMHRSEWDLDEYESTARLTLLLAFQHHGFRPNEKFLEDWYRYSLKGRVGTSAQFRKLFCDANHYQIQYKPDKWGSVVQVWGVAIPYYMDNGKPRLVRVLSKSWLLSQPGRSVGRPAFCPLKP